MSSGMASAWLMRDLIKMASGEENLPSDALGMGGKVLGPKNLGRKLWEATEGATAPRVLVATTVLATGLAMLGPHVWLIRPGCRSFAEEPDRIKDLRNVWEGMAEKMPLLGGGRIEPLLEWTDNASAEDEAAVGRCFAVLADIDLLLTTVRGCRGDLLGAVVYELLQRNDPNWPHHYRASFPPDVLPADARLFTPDWEPMLECLQRTEPYVDQVIEEIGKGRDAKGRWPMMWGDVLCKSGTLALSLAIHLKVRGHDPSEVFWVLGDPSAENVALTAVNVSLFGGFSEENCQLLSGADMDKMPKDAMGINRPQARPQPPRKRKPPRKPR